MKKAEKQWEYLSRRLKSNLRLGIKPAELIKKGFYQEAPKK